MLRYAITDRTRFAGDESQRQTQLIRQASEWQANGVNLIQLREKSLDAGVLVNLTRKLQRMLGSQHQAPKLLINSRADVAIAAQADGVHLTSAPGSLAPSHVRSLYLEAGLPDPVISISCHTLPDVIAAREAAATLILFGPVFEKCIGSELVSAGTGLDLLRTACVAAAPVPVLALGGVTESNTEGCLAAGAAGVAGIRLFAMGLTGPSVPG
jgi:thiamine-phosphate pyrophosphorylase